jgi:integrase
VLSRAISDHLVAIGCGDYVPHGLRHTSCTELADAGCDIAEIKAMSGHKTTPMVEHYIERASRSKAAKRAIEKRRVARAS